ncbi:hypothetical protein ACFL1Y_01510 [Patescibacteria group bacterium]
MLYNISKLLLEPAKPNSILDIFVMPSESTENSKLGTLFVLVEIKSRERGLKEKVKKIIEITQGDYYSSPVPNIEASLEKTCQNLNSTIKDVFNKPEAWYQKVNILIGATKEETLVFAQFGQFSGYLMRQNKVSQILNTSQQPTDEFLFSQLTTGEIKDNDALVLANYTLFDFFSLEKIKSMLNKLKPIQATEQFKNLIKENNRVPNIIAIVLKYESSLMEIDDSNNQTKKYLENLYSSQESMQRLENLKQRTSRTLGSSFLPNFKKILNSKNKKLLPANKVKKELKMPVNKNDVSLGSLKSTNLLSSIKKPNLPKIKIYKKESLIKLMIVLLVVFAGSLIYSSYYQKIKKRVTSNERILNSIQIKQDEAEAALIYQDKEKANQLLVSSLEELESLEKFNEKWIEKYNATQKDLKKDINKINNIYEVEIIQIAELIDEQIKKIVKKEDDKTKYVLSTANKVYSLNENNLNLLNIPLENVKDFALLEEDDGIILLDSNNKFYIYKNEQLEELNIVLLEDAILNDFKIYGDRLYILDSLHAIYKIAQPLEANPKISIWYNADKNLINSAKQIIVDGNIWVNRINQITKLYQNKKQEFEITKLNNALGNNLIIYTEQEFDNLYILDKENSRLVITDKTGVTLKQFLNPELTNANNFIIDEDDNLGLISIDQKVLEMDLNQE